jgi:chromosome segregation ATPase
LDKEKIEIAEKLILTEGNLARARKQLSSMQDNIDKLVKYVPGQPIKKQLETVKSELASYRKDTASRMMKLTEVESDLMKTKQALSDKEKDTKSLTQNYKDKLSEIVKSSKQLQNALAQTRNELSKARDEKNQTIIELAQEYTNMKNHVQLLQGELDETRKQGATKSTASKESKLLADALEKLTKSDNIIYSLRQNLTESRSQNTRITASHTLLSEKIKELEQVDIPSASEQTNTEPRQKIAQLEEALQLSRTKLADRDRQFENVVARMNLILERLHSSAAVQAP